jgi:MerR family transcriptional regulator, light-induced transcriptional regulator
MVSEGEFSLDPVTQTCSRIDDYRMGRTGPPGSVLQQETQNVRLRLEDVIEIEIGPRLVLLHRGSAGPLRDSRPSAEEIETLAGLAIGSDEAAATAYFETVRAHQHSFATLLTCLVAPAAQRLGELWQQDLCDFFDVTVGVGRLQALMDRFDSTDSTPSCDARRRAVLIALPGEKHLLGANMVTKVLEATGWSVTVEHGLAAERNARTVAEEWFGVLGLTVGADARLEQAARTIATVRRASMNPHIGVLVGGAAFNGHPEFVTQVGADAAGFDAPTAAVLASHLLMRQNPVC